MVEIVLVTIGLVVRLAVKQAIVVKKWIVMMEIAV